MTPPNQSDTHGTFHPPTQGKCHDGQFYPNQVQGTISRFFADCQRERVGCMVTPRVGGDRQERGHWGWAATDEGRGGAKDGQEEVDGGLSRTVARTLDTTARCQRPESAWRCSKNLKGGGTCPCMLGRSGCPDLWKPGFGIGPQLTTRLKQQPVLARLAELRPGGSCPPLWPTLRQHMPAKPGAGG